MNYTIGIDLGTTNSTLAFVANDRGEIESFQINQQITESLEAKKNHLPSFFLLPKSGGSSSVGWYAKNRSAEAPDQVIASAKSWLCHHLIDRRAPFLPLEESHEKRSPVEISAQFLAHLRQCWEKEHPQHPFKEQNLLITVPASFDPSALALVEEAAKMADFPEVRLIEEPLAAFYSWLYQQKELWRDHLKMGDDILVVDIGGDTTDFSLISVEGNQRELFLERKAVGSHLLLGGDNIDLALAHFAQNKLTQPLDEWQFQGLIHACRDAKEKLLGENPPSEVNLSVQGRGSRLIGGSLTIPIMQHEVEQIIVDGFFPKVPLDESIIQQRYSGITKIGLPFAKDPRITVQLAHFLSEAKRLPTAVLFNGGTMKAAAFQKRIVELLSQWRGEEVKTLEGADLDHAVSCGAAYYGWSRLHGGIRVKAATCRSYFVGVESSAPAIPGYLPPLKKIQIVPFGMEEGSEIALEEETFSLTLNEPAVFRFFTQNHPNQDELTELHPIETSLEDPNEGSNAVWVKLIAKITELGALELWCIADDHRKWKLEFDTRSLESLSSLC